MAYGGCFVIEGVYLLSVGWFSAFLLGVVFWGSLGGRIEEWLNVSKAKD